ncbi:dipeptidase PepV [Pseudalkalibacillus salsuginis]|uniref:dipeptidase PepV n=1 Tax=Pseudalkalibacillus salsuginis TaxID=2910972 RepID=UPI001F1EC602|nr:dipeptidase PepV [Pseudalkalibacillus salsuginis]MCF6408845.1 dipeptidase PepV [Pseudalkalibacillus salsuginis]
MIDWKNEVEQRKEEFIKDLQTLLHFESILDPDTAKEGAPFGEGIHHTLTHLLEKGESDGFTSKNLDGYAGHLEFGKGKELIGVLCHIDVVPAGDGWSSDPFAAEIRDGKIFARGAIDDKGPTMAAYYAMKIIKDLGIDLNRRVRLIIGTDEESNWRCVKHYFKHEEMPTMGFAPDASFPIIYAEKGLFDCEWKRKEQGSSEGGDVHLVSFESGRRLNMVPDFAEAVLEGQRLASIAEEFHSFIKDKELNGSVSEENGQYKLNVEGLSYHGSKPEKGKNAGLYLASFLSKYSMDEEANDFIRLANDYLTDDTEGVKLGIKDSDDITGPLTLNTGIMNYTSDKGGRFGLNLRYPVSHEFKRTNSILKEVGAKFGYELHEIEHLTPHHVPKDHELIKKLMSVYEQHTGDEGYLISIGGGTYARSLDAGVAFGAQFPGDPEIAHQKDEHADIKSLLRATAIYAQAIYELAK